MLLEDERYQFEAVTENLHTTLLERCTLTFSDPRVIDTINGCDALAWYREQRAALGFGETDFEHVTLTDPLGVNAHLSCEGGKLVSGRDLCPQMTLRLAKPDTVLPRMQASMTIRTHSSSAAPGSKASCPLRCTARASACSCSARSAP